MRKTRKFSEGGEVPDFSRLSFKEAFAAARGGSGAKTPMNKTFMWNGKKYSTNTSSGPNESKAETARLKRQNDAVEAPKAEAKPKREFKLPKVEYTDEVNDALLSSTMAGGIAGKLGKELTRAGELRAAAKMREGSQALKEASEGAGKVRNYSKEMEPTLGMKKGGKVAASRRGDGIAQRGKTRGKMR